MCTHDKFSVSTRANLKENVDVPLDANSTFGAPPSILKQRQSKVRSGVKLLLQYE